jgi:hypothetical protein
MNFIAQSRTPDNVEENWLGGYPFCIVDADYNKRVISEDALSGGEDCVPVGQWFRNGLPLLQCGIFQRVPVAIDHRERGTLNAESIDLARSKSSGR